MFILINPIRIKYSIIITIRVFSYETSYIQKSNYYINSQNNNIARKNVSHETKTQTQ